MNQKKTIINQYKESDVINFSKQCVYDGFFSLYEYHFQYKKFDGSYSAVISREILERKEAVLLLAYDPYTDEVVLIEQIRIGAFKQNNTPWLIEIIAGICDKEDESRVDVAKREALEEANIHVFNIKEVLNYFASPGGCTEKLFVMIGQVDASQAKGIHGLKEEDEDIKVHVVSRSEAFEWVESGFINNAGTIIALQWLQLNHQQLQHEWTVNSES